VALNKQLKMGLGIGCGFLVVVFLLIVGGGLPAQERIETFITVRNSLVEYHAGLESALEEYIAQKESNSGEGIMDVINSVRAGSRLGPAFALFWLARNETLLEHGMGAGEYAYIYCLAYYGHLNHDPGEGVTGLDGISISDAIVNVSVATIDNGHELNATEKARKRTSKMMVDFMEKIDGTNNENMPSDLIVWLGELETEVAYLQKDPFRIPFQDNGNETLAKVFDKYSMELEDSYVSRANPLELFFQQEEKEEQKEESSDES